MGPSDCAQVAALAGQFMPPGKPQVLVFTSTVSVPRPKVLHGGQSAIIFVLLVEIIKYEAGYENGSKFFPREHPGVTGNWRCSHSRVGFISLPLESGVITGFGQWTSNQHDTSRSLGMTSTQMLTLLLHTATWSHHGNEAKLGGHWMRMRQPGRPACCPYVSKPPRHWLQWGPSRQTTQLSPAQTVNSQNPEQLNCGLF